MEKGKLLFSLILTSIVVVSSVLVSGFAEAQKTTTVTVGVVMPITGPAGIVGISFVRGYELYFNKLNEEGGLNIGGTTYKFKVIADDSKMNFEGGVTAATKQVLQNKAIMVFGDLFLPACEGIYSVTSKHNVLHCVAWVHSPGDPADASPHKPLALRPHISQLDQTPVYFDQLRKTYPNVKFIVNVSPARDDYAPCDKVSTQEAAKRGLKMQTVKYEWGTEDFVPIMTKALALKPDALLMQSTAQATTALAARQLGFKGPIISNSPFPAEEWLRVVGPELSTDIICCGVPKDPSVKDIQNRWAKAYPNEVWISDSLYAWNEAWVIAQVMKKANSIDPAKIVATFESMTAPGSFKTSWGPGQAGGMETIKCNRRLVRPISMARIMDGKIQLVGVFPNPFN